MSNRFVLVYPSLLALAACASSPDQRSDKTAGGSYRAELSADGVVRLSMKEADLHIRTRALRVGGHEEPSLPRAVDTANDRLVIDRGDVREEHLLQPAGVEQRWTFATKPDGDGPLEIRVRIDGATYEGADDRGLRFVGPGGHVRYGLASWVDADGARDLVAVRVDGDDIVLTVPRERLEASRYPAVLDPLIGAEADLDGLSATTARFDQTHPVVAYANVADQYLAGWRDDRERAQGGAGSSIWATRLSWQGANLDRGGVRVTSLRNDPQGLSMACGPTVCLFAWEEGGVLRTARVTAAGVVQDFDGVVVSSTTAEVEPAVAWDGTQFIVVSRRRDSAGLLARRVDGATGGAAAPVVLSTWSLPTLPAIACATGACMITHLDGPSNWVAFTAITTSPSSISVARTAWHPAVSAVRPALAFDRVSASYVASFVAATGELHLARISPTGSYTTGEINAASSGIYHAEQVAVSCSNNGVCAATWNASPNTRVVRFRPDATSGLTLLDTVPRELGGGSDYLHYAALAADCCGGFYAATTWNAATFNGDSDVYGAAFSTTTMPTASIVSTSAPDARNQELESGAGTSLLVWEEYRAGRTELRGAIQSSAGVTGPTFVVRASELVTVPHGTVHSSPKLPAVAYNGAGWTVVWQERRTAMSTHDVYAVRVSSAGAVGTAVLVSGDPDMDEEVPDVACRPSGECVVSWFNAGFVAGTLTPGSAYRRLSATGAPSPSGVVRTPFATPGYALPPHVANAGTSFLFSTKLIVGEAGAGTVETFALKADGTRTAGFTAPTTVDDELDRVDVECGDSGCWTVWRNGVRGKGTIVGMLAGIDAAPRLGAPLTIGADIDATVPRVGCDGVGCLAAWTRSSGLARTSDVVSREVSWSGTAAPAVATIATLARFESTPVPARGTNTSFSVAYRTFHDDATIGAARGHLRTYAR